MIYAAFPRVMTIPSQAHGESEHEPARRQRFGHAFPRVITIASHDTAKSQHKPTQKAAFPRVIHHSVTAAKVRRVHAIKAAFPSHVLESPRHSVTHRGAYISDSLACVQP